MDVSETAALLHYASAFDRRVFTKAEAVAWQRLLERYTYADCEAAVQAHFASSREWMMPFDVISHVQSIRAERLRRHGTFIPTLDDPEDPRYLEAYRAEWESIANGTGGNPPRRALEGR